MTDWSIVKWPEARQIVTAIDTDGVEGALDDETPQGYFDRVRRASPQQAVSFLAHALPRLETVAWAAATLRQLDSAMPVAHHDRQSLDKALRWVIDPCDDYRRAAFAAAENAGEASAERMLSMAVFFSGGSIAPADLEPVHPEPHVCAKLASSAIVIKALATINADQALSEALDLGGRVAEKGMEALEFT